MSDNKSSNPDVQGFDDPSPKTPKWLKYLAGTAVGLVLVSGGVSVLVPSIIDQQKYKSMIVDKVSESTGYQVDWKGNIGISLLPLPHITVSDLTVSANDQKIISIKSADIEVALFPLLSKKIEVKDITLEEPQMTLVTLKNGQQTWMTKQIVDKQEKPTSDTDKKSESDSSSSMDVSLNVVEITDGIFIWDDQSSGTRHAVEDVDLRLKADSLSGPFEMNGGLTYGGRKVEAKINTSDMDMDNGIYPVQIKLALPESNIRAAYSGVITNKDILLVEGDMSLEVTDFGVALAAFSGDDAPEIPKELQGKTSLSGKITYSPEKIALSNLQVLLGELDYAGNFSAANLADKTKTPQISFSLRSNQKADGSASPLVKFMDDLSVSATATMSGNKILLEQSNLKLDENDISLKGSVTLDDKKTVDLVATVKKLDIDQIQKKLGVNTSDESSSDVVDIAESAGSEKKSFGFSVPFEGRMRGDIEEVVLSQKSYKDIHFDISSSQGSLKINKMDAELPDGISIKSSGTIGNTEKLSDLDIGFKTNIADVEAVARNYNVTLPELPRKIGAATINGKVTGGLKALGFDMNLGVWGGTASGAGTVAGILGTPVINKLKFSLNHPNFPEVMRIVQPSFIPSSTMTGALSLSGDVAWGDNQYHVSALKGTLGKTSLDGNFDVETSPKATISGALNIGDLVIPMVSVEQQSSVGSSKSAPQSPKGGAKWSREAIDVAWMKKFNADLKITAKSLAYDMWNFSNANLDFLLNDGTLDIKDMSAGLFGGQAAVSGQIKTGSGERDPLGIMAQMNAENVDGKKLQSALMGKPNDTISGTISKVDFNVNATGLSPAALVQTLSGQGNIEGRDIIVKGVDAVQLATAAKGSYKPMERAGTLFGSFGNGQTEFTIFVSEFVIQNGIVNFSKILFDGAKASLNGTGNINLPQWTIDLKNTMTIKDTDIPPFDFTIKGSLDNPTKAGGDVIENYLRGKLEKKVNKLIEKQLGKFLGTDQAPEPTSAPVSQDIIGTEVPMQDIGQDAAPAPAPAPEKKSKDDIKKEALKALGGLLGQ
ncbi:MAG: AsmA family protein [Alphaproteobacteria bacterium]|nr:AsmA family protein [Alphaproteobacteria bacterium]